MRKFRQMSFRLKLALSFAVTFIFIYISSTVLLANAASQRSLNDGRELLSLLTEQVLINIDQTISTTEKQVFNVYSSLDIPEIMGRISPENNGNDRQAKQTLQYIVNQMVSAVYPFDFVLVRTLDGQDIHTGEKIPSGDVVYQHASQLLDGYSGGHSEWVRDEDGGVYFMRTIYSVSPLVNVGKIIVRIPDNRLLRLGVQSENLKSSMLLFDQNQALILSTGEIDQEKQLAISELIRSGRLMDDTQIWLGTEYYVVVRSNNAWTLIGLLPMEQLYSVRKDVWVTSLIIAAFGLLIGMLIVTMSSRRLTRQLNVLSKTMDAVAVGDMKQSVPIYSQDDIGQIAIRFNNMTHEISELLNRLVNEEKVKNEAEFKMLEYRYRSLHTQINSHFIFNALETVNAFAKLEGNKEISKVVQLVSRYFRNNVRNATHQYITLEREFDYLRDYAKIYQYIHGDRLVIQFECDEVTRDALIPTMILQPVLENALQHGMRAAKEQTYISLSGCFEGEDTLAITIADDGPGIPDEVKKRLLEPENQNQRKDARTGIGLRNVAERLQIIYAEQASISVESGSQGTCVKITLPRNSISQLPIEME